MSDHLSIQSAIDRLIDGTIRVPGFQRKFVWPPQRSALLMDSIYKQFPVGSILLWRTSERLKRENQLGTFVLPPPDKDYPVDYVLDGQQRLTAIFTAFQRSLVPAVTDPDSWLPIYYDFAALDDVQDSRFVALADDQVDTERHFPLAAFLEPVEFSLLTRNLDEPKHREIARVQQRFLSLLIPVQTFETEDRTSVAIVFERVNRMGIPLDTYQLLTAWTWSEEFNLQQRFLDLAEEFGDFGFEDVGDDSDLMMRCTAAVLMREPSPTSLVDVNGASVREAFPIVENAIRRSIDFVRANFHVRHLKFLPYSSMLIPLAAFFSVRQSDPVTDEQRRSLVRWFWRCAFSHRYSGNPQRNIKRDIDEAVKLRQGLPNTLGEIYAKLGPDFFLSNTFSGKNVASKTLILLLASLNPRSFISGEPVPIEDVLAEPNRKEYHHCFPRAHLAREGAEFKRINSLANFAIISRSDNRTISDKAPSEYRRLMPIDIEHVRRAALLPDALFDDNFDLFLAERARRLAELGCAYADLKLTPQSFVIEVSHDDIVAALARAAEETPTNSPAPGNLA
ncbi:GmrSD restriction endonuclease domain-containing protein [Micromonospora sp. NBC_00421]|uniref:GmrSD restriction endonuclease domain-containing protein n=1 Tax=Micromonospora sp. NBC_00421 TaxID=2975976 RepID=UPI002E2278EF